MRGRLGRVGWWLACAAGGAAAAYLGHAGLTWYRYGHPSPGRADDADALLDRFMPRYDVVERHRTRVSAPASVTLAAAQEMDLQRAVIVRGIFRLRELVLGSEPVGAPRPKGLLADVLALGWGVLAESPGREIVVGAVTQPWMANVTFRALPADAFAGFQEPGFVKIAWTLRADPVGPGESFFRTETRAVATDVTAREKFRRYWSLVSPGIWMIRRMTLAPLRRDAEQRARGKFERSSQ